MSLVIAAFNNEIGVLAHDGRAKNQDGEIIDEHYNKSFQVNENVVVGYAGDAFYCDLMIGLLKDTIDLESASVIDVYKAFRLPDEVINDLNNYTKLSVKNRNGIINLASEQTVKNQWNNILNID